MNEKVIAVLNDLLADELTATNQYMVHSSMCENWGYDRLHEKVEARAITEMRHAEKLIDRILFLEGAPVVSKLNPMHIGASVEIQLNNDQKAEIDAIQSYNQGIQLCGEQVDYGTREILESILADEEDHKDWLDAQLDQIDQMGIQNYLMAQAG